MVKVIYKNPIAYTTTRVLVTTKSFPPDHVDRAAATHLSIFILTVELLGLAICQNNDIHGLELNGTTIKCGQFEDDLWTAILTEPSSLDAILAELDTFSNFSGLVINPEKCMVLRLGPFRNTEAKYYTMRRLFGLRDQ